MNRHQLLFTMVLVLFSGPDVLAEEYKWELPPGFTPPPVPTNNPMTAEKVELGRYLFYDVRMSVNGEQSCASCHVQRLAFTDGKPRSVGATGQLHPRGSMSLVNVAWSRSLAWSAPNLTLEDQMHMPMFGKTPVELGMDREAKTFLKIVRSDKLYQRLFRNAFPGVQNPFTVTNVVKAIASFERSIVSARSDWDEDWQQVQRTSSAHRAPPRTSIAAQRGESLFFSEKLACAKCHGGTNFDGSFSSAAQRESGAVFHNNGMPAGDPGLSEYTQAVQDVGKFKAPTMRNIELTAPYMHDGSLATLEAVVDHYAAGGSHTPTQSPLVRGFVLSERDRGDLVAFLRSLTDHPVTVDPRFSDPWKRAGVSGSQRSPQ